MYCANCLEIMMTNTSGPILDNWLQLRRDMRIDLDAEPLTAREQFKHDTALRVDIPRPWIYPKVVNDGIGKQKIRPTPEFEHRRKPQMKIQTTRLVNSAQHDLSAAELANLENVNHYAPVGSILPGSHYNVNDYLHQ